MFGNFLMFGSNDCACRAHNNTVTNMNTLDAQPQNRKGWDGMENAKKSYDLYFILTFILLQPV